MKHSPSFLTYYLKICGIHYKIRLLFSLEFHRQADFTDLCKSSYFHVRVPGRLLELFYSVTCMAYFFQKIFWEMCDFHQNEFFALFNVLKLQYHSCIKWT